MKSPKRKFHQKKKRLPLNLSEKAIVDTLCYRAVFNYPMSYHQLGTFLTCDYSITKTDFDNALNSLVRKKRIIKNKNGQFLLMGIKPVDRKERTKDSQFLFNKVEGVVNILKKVPWVKLIGATGALAAFNATKDDDIDIFIITEKNRLWLTRGFVFLILVILGELRKDENPKRKICPNILIDEKNMRWKKSKRNVYIAHVLLMMHPIFDRDNTYFRFFNKNNWVKKYFPNIPVKFDSTPKSKESGNILMFWLESLARTMQKGYMKKRKTKEIVKKDFIHFNKSDNTERILNSYKKLQKEHL